MKLTLRILLWLTYPFLVLSFILIGGTLFGGAFNADFTVENRTGQTIAVTPVGTVGKEGAQSGNEGAKSRLPTIMSRFLPLPALRAGGFRLAPGESVTILYDMDDINFSEIVVDDGQGQLRQLVVNPSPTTNQYRAPRRGQQFLIDNLADLAPADSQVAAAARRAQAFPSGALIFNALLLGPWLAYAALRFGLARLEPRQDGKAVRL